MQLKRILGLTSLLLALVLVLSACAGDGEVDETPEEGENEGETETSEGEGGDLTIAVPADISEISPQGSNDVPSSNVQENVFETLVYLDENTEAQPRLAEDWEVIDDTTYEFKIREGVKFHDGSDLNAEVVKANFDRLMDPDTASPQASLVAAVESVEVVDEFKVRFNLEYPYGPLINNLAHTGTSIMSPKVIEEDAKAVENGESPGSYINENPVGTGPFEFDEWTPGESVVLTKNEDYWGDQAKLDSITFQVISENSTRLAELDTGSVDIMANVSPDSVSRVENGENSSLLEQESTSLSYLGFNTQSSPLDDERVRRAISMAVDKEEIIEGIYNGYGVAANSPVPPTVFGHDESVEGIEYNKEEAKALLEEAGYGDGLTLNLMTNNDNQQRMYMAEYVASELEDLNIEVNIEGLEFGSFIDKASNGDHDLFILGWSTPTMDADYATYNLFHSEQHGEAGNMTFLENEEVDKLLDQARQESDPEARKELYSELQQKLVELAPMHYVHHQTYLLGVNDRVKDFSVAGNGIYQFRDTYIEE
ncbi:glutathione ABC transporter substrate-binding protein [Aquisalibacillus elongatus]|uniref:Peptide/nickel transport system substrate-binding protein n=1 Tax=Aquisalibacillus elongatus TaxID=485577 RepID=A0A3N5B8E3_9BACI|nr:glutathione ABC transporter substrate-binding protein [Aquisalibacillus elongatus]RPF54006.1 peptide/nickel transport system substrate-binding protein [Aquisalibacillus elongatus]